jgi:hypothetical protein
MKRQINVPEELFLQVYQFLVLYGLLHGIGETDMFNSKLREMEEIYEEQTGESI